MELSPNQSLVILEYFQEDTPVLFFLLSESGQIMSVNRYCKELLGKSVVGQFFGEQLVDFQRSFRLEEHVAKTVGHSLLSLNIPDSLPRSYMFSFRRVNDSILVFGKNDAEELELLRLELLHANQELNNLTRSLHKKNAQLASLNTIKNQFLGMAAHDLRRPISVILGYAEFLIEETREQLDKEHTGFLGRIKNSAVFMKRLVDDFLDVSVIESGRFELNITPANPSDILRKSLVLARIQAGKKEIGLNVNVASGLYEVPLDADKIEQAMSNLLSNAIEHSATGSCIFVTLQEIDEKIVFSVRDQGSGMNQEAIKQLFIPFSKTGTVKTGGEKSTGLGLTITRKIIDAHKGEITVESEEGTGTTFTIFLNRKLINEQQ
jgi:signal transduction histidine kinase